MERAAMAGFCAADLLLEARGLTGAPVPTGPRRGLLARWFA
jgi:hypothetical protein